jgi:hypothetical protein
VSLNILHLHRTRYALHGYAMAGHIPWRLDALAVSVAPPCKSSTALRCKLFLTSCPCPRSHHRSSLTLPLSMLLSLLSPLLPQWLRDYPPSARAYPPYPNDQTHRQCSRTILPHASLQAPVPPS